MSRRKLVLTGFMGTGKTTLAHLIAEKVGVPLVDTDELIAQRSGLSIPQIFERMGEAGFRAWEVAICAELGADPRPLVISTGGGMLVPLANRQALEPNATLVCLTARPEVIYERLKDMQDRPLLAVDDPIAQIRRLLQQRDMAYGAFRWQVDTSDQTPQALADQIIALWERDSAGRATEQLIRAPEGNYPLVIQHGALGKLSDLLDIYGLSGHRTIIASNTTIAPLYAETLIQQLPNSALVTMPDGETYKDLESVNRMFGDFARYKLDRSGLVIALGGGVVGDTVGYAASSYMRGVNLVQIPTSLLAMVDSSVGGKVGVDIALGKNMVGAFKQPNLVVIDPDVLRTLPVEEFRAGMAEIIKHGLLANPDLIEKEMPIEARIRAAVQVKIDVVQRDPYELGERAYLNLGHTFGHAIERVSGYTWRHGDGVAVGLVGAMRLSEALGFIDSDLSTKVEKIIEKNGLPTRYRDFSPQAIWEAMHADKKWRDGRSHFVVLRGIGKPDMVTDVPYETVIRILEGLRQS